MQQQKQMVSSACIKRVGMQSAVNHEGGNCEATWHNAFCAPKTFSM
jgi:hypothetical protein